MMPHYQDQAVSLYCGDYREVLPALGICGDVLITDPPYQNPPSFESVAGSVSGNILAFCTPERLWTGADEYLYWVKPLSTKNFSRRCGRFVEMIAVYRRGDAFTPLHWSQMVGVYEDRLVEKPEHPWEKPLSLIERLVRIYSRAGDVILDPFAGVGTTLLAAKGLGRKAIGIEIDMGWCEKAAKRLASVKGEAV